MNEYEVANGHKRPDQYSSGGIRVSSFPDYRESEQLVGVSVLGPTGGASGTQPLRTPEVIHRWTQKFCAIVGGSAFIGGIITVAIQNWR